MCKCVDSACFIANTFAVTKSRSLALIGMRSMVEEVENALQDKNVVIDWTRDSVLSAFEYHSLMFEKHRDKIYRTNDSAKYFQSKFMKQAFNCGLDEELVGTMQKAIRLYIKNKRRSLTAVT